MLVYQRVSHVDFKIVCLHHIQILNSSFILAVNSVMHCNVLYIKTRFSTLTGKLKSTACRKGSFGTRIWAHVSRLNVGFNVGDELPSGVIKHG